MDKCPELEILGFDGHFKELDGCQYEEVEIYKNVTVHILKCKKCGNIDIEWERQDNTEEVTNE